MFNRPQLTALVKSLREDMLSRVGDESQLRRADAEVYARVFAGALHGLYAYADWIARQIIWDTCDADTLDRIASMWLTVPRKPAAAATGAVTFVLAVGVTVPTGTVLQAFDGVQYTTTAASAASAAPVVAVLAGAAGNRAAGQALSLVSPVPGAQTQATAGEISGGSDIETTESLRARLIARVQTPPDGGSTTDYKIWALEVAGVTRAWVAPLELGAGTVTVRFVRDNDAGGLIPDAAEIATVKAYLDTKRPATAELYVVAPVAAAVNFTITLTPSTAAVKAAIEAELRDLLLREAAPGVTLLLSHIREAISLAAGETDHVLTVPVANITPAVGTMPTFGAITWL